MIRKITSNIVVAKDILCSTICIKDLGRLKLRLLFKFKSVYAITCERRQNTAGCEYIEGFKRRLSA